MDKYKIEFEKPNRETRETLEQLARGHAGSVDLRGSKSGSGVEILTLVFDNLPEITTTLTALMSGLGGLIRVWRNGESISREHFQESAKKE